MSILRHSKRADQPREPVCSGRFFCSNDFYVFVSIATVTKKRQSVCLCVECVRETRSKGRIKCQVGVVNVSFC